MHTSFFNTVKDYSKIDDLSLCHFWRKFFEVISYMTEDFLFDLRIMQGIGNLVVEKDGLDIDLKKQHILALTCCC
jgi:hypothetical protein